MHPERDAPGFTLAKAGPTVSAQRDLVLDCRPLVETLLGQLDRLQAGVRTIDLGLPGEADEPLFRDLMQRLVRHWGNVATRQYSRLRTHARVELLVGLRAIWKFLTGAVHGAGPRSEPNQWMVTNESPGGYALMHLSGKFGPIRVGEVMAVRTGESCHICVVRWVLSDNPQHLELGVQELAPGATPVALGSDDGSEVEHALLIPEMPALRKTSAILAPYGQVDDSREYLVGGEDSRLRVRATRLLEQTLAVQLFQFSVAGLSQA